MDIETLERLVKEEEIYGDTFKLNELRKEYDAYNKRIYDEVEQRSTELSNFMKIIGTMLVDQNILNSKNVDLINKIGVVHILSKTCVVNTMPLNLKKGYYTHISKNI